MHHLLLSNDDGIAAAGLRTLWEGLRGVGHLSIVAPAEERSGMGTSLTFMGPLRAQRVLTFGTTPAWQVWGFPADCVKVGISGLLEAPPDLIVSGVNHGANAGRGIFSSGTAGCVIQGVLQGIPGIAFSYACEEEIPSFPHIKEYLAKIVGYVLEHPLTPGSFLNVNFPRGEIRGVRLARQGRFSWNEGLRKQVGEDGNIAFHFNSTHVTVKEHPDSDVALLKQGFVTAVPIQLEELTDHLHFSERQAHFNNRF